MSITRRLQIDVGLLGRDVINQMSDTERDKFHGYLDQRQEYFSTIDLNGETFELGIARRETKATILIKPEESSGRLYITEEADHVFILIPKRVPQTVIASLPGKTISEATGSISGLPILDSLVIEETEIQGNYLTIKARTTWDDYQADYIREENW